MPGDGGQLERILRLAETPEATAMFERKATGGFNR